LTVQVLLDFRTAQPYITTVRIHSIRHRGLKRFLEGDDNREIRPDLVNRVRRILTALISAPDMDGVQGPPGWRVHQLTGDRAGTWSVSASGNWRITFTVEGGEICHLNLEDYH
jgi:toxin HigB-1